MVSPPDIPTLRLVIPSFNRGCQLECLLRSLFDTCPEASRFTIVVFHRSTDAAFERGYEIVRAAYPGVQFVQQDLTRSFKRQFLDLVGDEDLFGFIVDDMVVLDTFSLTDRPFELLLKRPDIFSLSLRLDLTKTFSQPVNQPAASPRFDDDLVWRWKPRLPRGFRLTQAVDRLVLKSAFYDWAVPCALDGTVFRTELFSRFFESIDDFENIPFMEGSLTRAVSAFANAPPNMVRYDRCKTLSLAMNSVDEYHDFPSLGLDPGQFNERFLDGDRLDYSPFGQICFHACHVVTAPFWLPRER